MDIYAKIVARIIEQQESIMGPIAIEQAKRVAQLKVDWPQHKIDLSGDPQAAVDMLVEQYKELFGQIAVETCRDAVQTMIAGLPKEQIPSTLK